MRSPIHSASLCNFGPGFQHDAIQKSEFIDTEWAAETHRLEDINRAQPADTNNGQAGYIWVIDIITPHQNSASCAPDFATYTPFEGDLTNFCCPLSDASLPSGASAVSGTDSVPDSLLRPDSRKACDISAFVPDSEASSQSQCFGEWNGWKDN